MDDWIDASHAAQLLGVGARQVRNLAERGALPARRVGRSWLLDAAAVRSRAAHAPNAGRPLSPAMTGQVLRIVQAWLDPRPDAPADEHVLDAIADRQVRYRLRQLLSEPGSARRWENLLRSRAERRRIWVHPGVVDRLSSDHRLHAGGGFAASAHGLGIVAAPAHRFYVAQDDLAAVMSDYHARENASGQIELLVFNEDEAKQQLGEDSSVPAAVALADLLDSDDARERHLAAETLERFTLSGKA